MSGLKEAASVGVDQVIDLADNTTAQLVPVLKDLKDVAASVATAPINVGDKALDAALDEVEELRGKLMDLVRSIKTAVTETL